MARLARLTVAGHMHYVVQRGHGHGPVFVDDVDRCAFVDALQSATRAHEVAVHAFTLLDDRVLWLATPREAAGLSRAVQAMGRRFVGDFNRRHGLRGTRWEGRFRSAVVDAEHLGMPLAILLEQQCVEAGQAVDAREWPWSTARHHLGIDRLPWISDVAALWRLGNTPYEREAAYDALLRSPMDLALKLAVTAASDRGWPYGNQAFITSLTRFTPRVVQPRLVGRPRRR